MKNASKSAAGAKVPATRTKTVPAAVDSVSSTPDKSRGVLKETSVAFDQVYMFAPQERIEVIKRGIPAAHVGVLSAKMDLSKDNLIATLGLSRATISRKVREKKALSQDESERVLGIESLIGQVEAMIKESGDSDGFNAAKWVAGWLNSPLPALGGKTPASYMDTFEGQKLVSNLLAMAQSSAYA